VRARIERWRGYGRAIVRSVRRGDTFPAAGRVPAADAPGGTVRTVLRGGLNEVEALEISVHRVPVPGLARPLRVLHLSDVHLREADGALDRLLDAVRDRPPCDLLALTGDVVTRGWTRAAVDRFLSAMPAAPLGRFAVMGNWEHWSGATPDVWEPIVSAHGIRLLRDESVDVGPLTVVGTEDMLAGKADVDRAFAGVPADRPALVLSHSPAIFPQVARPPARLVLSGHTHGGQVRLPLLGPVFLPRGSGDYPWGWYAHDGVQLFVHRGLGWSVAPVRYRALPEIAEIELVPDRAADGRKGPQRQPE
jgi:predicted MPP superfamily phosphohydrolase